MKNVVTLSPVSIETSSHPVTTHVFSPEKPTVVAKTEIQSYRYSLNSEGDRNQNHADETRVQERPPMFRTVLSIQTWNGRRVMSLQSQV